MRNHFCLLCVLLLVEGVSGDEKVTVTVMEGDSVTLNPAEIQTKDTKLWKFNDLIIPSNAVSERFRDRLKLENLNGSLTITNTRTTDSGFYQLKIKKDKEVIFKNYTVTVREITIRNIQRDQSGVYELKINTRRLILHRKLHITVTGKMKTVSVMEGEPIILLTGLFEIRGYDLILWKFGDHLIAEINKSANQVLLHDTSDKRFKGRLQPNRESGDLTIRDSRTTDSGDYHLNMSSSSHTVQRTISVTVSVSAEWKMISIVLIVFMIVIVIVIIVGIKKGCVSWPSRRTRAPSTIYFTADDSNVPVNGQT